MGWQGHTLVMKATLIEGKEEVVTGEAGPEVESWILGECQKVPALLHTEHYRPGSAQQGG